MIRVRASLSTLALLVAAILAPSTVAAAGGGEPGIRLALLPVGQAGAYFDLTMVAGERRDLQVDVANDGDESLAVRAYATDVYTIVNGGFGGRLRGSPATGTTTWVDFASEVVELPAGRSIRRDLRITVPLDATPGEYITGLVLENERPIAGVGAGLDQIVRQAVGVVVTVPGPRLPALGIGVATYRLVAGRPVVAIAVENTGNVRLKPVVAFALSDATETELYDTSLQMDTFYARTDTYVEVPLASPLPPGVYLVRLTLDAAGDGARVVQAAVRFTVEAPTPVATDGGFAAVVADSIRDDGGLWSAGVAILLVVLVLAAVGWRMSRRNRRRSRVAATDG